MIEFLTLFIGLHVGVQEVELGVGGGGGEPVAWVELLLDGETVERRRRPPWVLRCDFGQELAPHELVAVARSEAGSELGRARQLINVPRDLAEASVVLLPREEGQPPRARVAWQASDFQGIPEIRVSLDGSPVAVSRDGLVELPEYDPDQIHLLRAELLFSPTLQALAEVVFGGVYADEVTTELTAVPLVGRKKLPDLEEMQDWFRYDGRPVRAVAVERGSAELFVVRGRSAATLQGLRGLATKRRVVHQRGNPASSLRRGSRMRFVFPVARSLVNAQGIEQVIFPLSEDLSTVAAGRIDRILTELFYDEDVPSPQQQLADAVAIAGVRAAAGNRPRAVVLVTNPGAASSGFYQAASVEGFLQKLHVPLSVWMLPSPRLPPGELTLVADDAWSRGRMEIGSGVSLDGAIRRTLQTLDSQFIVWLEGSFLPHRIEITEAAGEVEFAG